MSTSYFRLYADTRRSSSIAGTSAGTGTLSWEVPLNDDEKIPFNPRGLLACNSSLVVYSDRAVAVFNASGKRRWTDTIIYGSPVSIDDRFVYYQQSSSFNDRLHARSFDGTVVDSSMVILDAGESSAPIYIEASAEHLYAMCFYKVHPEQGPPECIFYKKKPDGDNYIWVANFESPALFLPLHLPALNRFIVFSMSETILYESSPATIEKEVQRFPYPLQQTQNVSADQKGILYYVGFEEGKLLLCALSLAGKELWRSAALPFTGTKKPLLPPVIDATGNVHVVAGSSITTVANGESINTFSIAPETIDEVTALADGSLLAVTPRALYQIAPDRSIAWEFAATPPIQAPAVIDNNGSVYIVTMNKLLCLR